jgi:hypothetical protein
MKKEKDFIDNIGYLCYRESRGSDTGMRKIFAVLFLVSFEL